MTKNEDISKPFKVIERQTLEVENVVEDFGDTGGSEDEDEVGEVMTCA